MSFINDTLEPGELVAYKARVSPFAYLFPLLFILTMMTPGKLTSLLSTELALTEKRVVGKVGMFRRRHITWPHGKVDIVRVQKGLLGGLFNFGTVTFLSRDGGKVKFYGISRPLELQRRAEEFIEIALLGRVLPRDDKDLPPLPPLPQVTKVVPRIEEKPAAPATKSDAPAAASPAAAQTRTFGRKRSDDTVW